MSDLKMIPMRESNINEAVATVLKAYGKIALKPNQRLEIGYLAGTTSITEEGENSIHIRLYETDANGIQIRGNKEVIISRNSDIFFVEGDVGHHRYMPLNILDMTNVCREVFIYLTV